MDRSLFICLILATVLNAINSTQAQSLAQPVQGGLELLDRLLTLPSIEVANEEELHAALVQSTGDINIVLLRNISLTLPIWDSTAPIPISNRTIQFGSALNYLPDVTSSVDVITMAGGKVLNFSYKAAVLRLEDTGILALNGIQAVGIASQAQYLDTELAAGRSVALPFGSSMFPSVLASSGSIFAHNNSMVAFTSDGGCNATSIGGSALRAGLALNTPNNTGVIPNALAVYINGAGVLNFPVVDGATRQPIGSINIVVNNTIRNCTPFLNDSLPASSATSSDTGDDDSLPAWAWVLIALAISTFTAAALIAIFIAYRRKWCRLRPSDTTSTKTGSNPSDLELQAQHPGSTANDALLLIQLKNAWHSRIGEAYNIQFLGVLGRGSFGTVYHARWHSSEVAVKLVEHTLSSSITRHLQREAAVATSVSHPNVVHTFKVATLGISDVQNLPNYVEIDSKQQVVDVADAVSVSVGLPAAAAGVSGAGGPASSMGTNTLSSLDLGSSAFDDDWQEAEKADGATESVASLIIMEICDMGSVQDLIDTKRLFWTSDGKPDQISTLRLLMDVAQGLDYLHTVADIVHGDIKPANVLVKSAGGTKRGWVAKLADFGVARLIDHHQTMTIQASIGMATPVYMPPELITNPRASLSKATDSYSYGIMMWQVWMRQQPFQHLNTTQLAHAIATEGARPLIPADSDMPAAYQDLMQRCWATDPHDRPSMEEVLEELPSIMQTLH